MQPPPVVTINLHEKPRLAATAHNVHQGSDRFRLVHHWSFHVYRYHARLLVDDTAIDIFPGCATLVPPNTVMEFHYRGTSHHIYAHFSLPSPRVESRLLAVPMAYNLRENCRRFEQQMESVGELLPLDRFRAEIKFWDLLWELVGQSQNDTSHHPSLEKALSLIELRLSEEISVTSLAREVGISHNHLTRLFRQATGNTVVAYVRHRRALHAKHLLEHTTMPLKHITAQINIGDLQSFSTLMKKETGHSPRYWREQSK